jgi:hypothetical protein|tara:strand:- start:488 stop:682 length:195 start_codon:yes stop_codon:yes gene_type:complete
MSFLFASLPIDIEEMIEKNVIYKRNMNKVINEITEQGGNLIVYYYKDGCNKPAPFFLCEFDCMD